jgi:hypothetical protein
MSHYDYLSPHMAGLAGHVEDLASVAVKSVAEHVGKNREAAWNYFRFGVADLSKAEREGRIAGWKDLTPAFKVAMDALKPFMFPHAFWMDLKDFKLEDRLRLQADLKSKFDAEWAKAFPSSAAPAAAPAAAPTSPFSRTGMLSQSLVSRIPTGPLGPRSGASAGAGIGPQGADAGGGDAGGAGGAGSKFPVVPVAIGAAVLAALLLLKRK